MAESGFASLLAGSDKEEVQYRVLFTCQLVIPSGRNTAY